MIWYGRVQSPAVFKRQGGRWCRFALRFRYQLTIFGSPELIGLSRLLHAHFAYETDTTKNIEFPIFCMIWYFIVQSPAVSKRQDVRWCSFRWSIPLWIGDVWHSCIDRAISHHWRSYCKWNRYCQNHRSILPNFPLFAWFDTVEFNCQPCSNNKMYDDTVFPDRFRYQLTKFEDCILIGLFRLLGTHIAY